MYFNFVTYAYGDKTDCHPLEASQTFSASLKIILSYMQCHVFEGKLLNCISNCAIYRSRSLSESPAEALFEPTQKSNK